ncbi:MAG: ACP S-malonyltransferase [bacterium]
MQYNRAPPTPSRRVADAEVATTMPKFDKIAYLFPGQGAQYAGIGKDLHDQFAVVRDAYAEAGDALGYDIAELSFAAADSSERINLTRFTQPVLLTHSIACLRALRQQTDFDLTTRTTLAAGHSLGEYTALVAADALSFAQALRLVKTRGELMGAHGRGEMEALMIDRAGVESLAARHCCGIAACNLPTQTVVGGAAEDLDALVCDLAAQRPRMRSTRLKTEGAFHTYYMVEAALRFREALAQTEIAAPRFAVLSNFTGDFHDADADAIKSRLFMQLFNPVLWHQNLTRAADALAAADALLIEFGGGLGAGDAPADKRPNLEAIVKKTCRGDSAPAYRAVINARTLAETVAVLDE